jgi:uncharacterized membrane protein YeiH
LPFNKLVKNLFYTIDILGTIAFAISGVLVAMNKKMDLFGILIIAFVTAVGGGTLRDILIGQTPVGWMKDMTFTYVILGSTVFAVIARNKINYLRTSLFLFDTIGIGLYTVIGIEKGLSYFLIRKLPLESDFVFMIAGAIVIIVRLLAVKFKIALPNIYKTN